MEVLILAGGLGRRLGNLTKHTPKPMLKVNNKIFITYLIDFFIKNDFKKINISAGYKQSIIKKFFFNNTLYKNIKIFSEKKILGTGGAIKFFLNRRKRIKNLVVVNGDTFFDFNLKKAYQKFKRIKKSLIVCTKIRSNLRYGSILVNKKNIITKFFQKKNIKKKYKLINSGFYFFKKSDLANLRIPSSLEWYLENNVNKMKISTYVSTGTFIDIGIKKDFKLSHKILYKL